MNAIERKAKIESMHIENKRLRTLTFEQGEEIVSLIYLAVHWQFECEEAISERDEARRVARYWYRQCLEARAELSEVVSPRVCPDCWKTIPEFVHYCGGVSTRMTYRCTVCGREFPVGTSHVCVPPATFGKWETD